MMKWCVPVKDSMKLAVSARSCSDNGPCRAGLNCQLQAGDPRFGAGFQRGHVVRCKAETDVRLRNSAASPKVKRSSATRSSVSWPRAEPGQRQRRILAGGDDQVHPRRQVLKQKGHGTVNRFGIKNVVVVKDKDETFREGGDLVDQGRQKRFGWRRLRGLERSQHSRAKARRNPLRL